VKSEIKKQVITIKELIRFFEELKAKTEEHLRVVRDAELNHPKSIEIKEFGMERLEKQLDHLKETLKKLKELLS